MTEKASPATKTIGTLLALGAAAIWWHGRHVRLGQALLGAGALLHIYTRFARQPVPPAPPPPKHWAVRCHEDVQLCAAGTTTLADLIEQFPPKYASRLLTEFTARYLVGVEIIFILRFQEVQQTDTRNWPLFKQQMEEARRRFPNLYASGYDGMLWSHPNFGMRKRPEQFREIGRQLVAVAPEGYRFQTAHNVVIYDEPDLVSLCTLLIHVWTDDWLREKAEDMSPAFFGALLPHQKKISWDHMTPKHRTEIFVKLPQAFNEQHRLRA